MPDKIVLTDDQKTEVVNAFKANDFTVCVPLKRKHNIVGENAKVFLKAKKFFGQTVNLKNQFSQKMDSLRYQTRCAAPFQ